MDIKKIYVLCFSPTGGTERIARFAAGELAGRLGRKVKIAHKGRKGRIELEYYGVDDLNDLLDALALVQVQKKGPEA